MDAKLELAVLLAFAVIGKAHLRALPAKRLRGARS